MNDEVNTPMQQPSVGNGNERIMTIASLVLGVISLCGVVVPIIGVPLAIAGIILGFLGRRDVSQKSLATAGIVISIIGILLSCVPVGVIAVMRLLGPKIGNTFSTINNSLP